jgi:nitroimidazol reductase NimA-like FMN-containing flavoprotein (pyridoxamine 5'-phosphate oxidase superfamily)
MDEMSIDQEIQPVLRYLFRSQRYAVLATDDHGQPFASLMAFAASEDLRQIVLLTARNRRKFANLKANRRVALMIDDRENKGSDTQESVALTVIGEAQEANPEAGAALLNLFLARHPDLTAFATAPSCAVVTVAVSSYLLVSRFEQVLEWRIGS